MIDNNINNKPTYQYNTAGIITAGGISCLATGLISTLNENDKLIDRFEKTTGEKFSRQPAKNSALISIALGIIAATAFAASPAGKRK